MSKSVLSTGMLGRKSVLQLTLWPSSRTLRTLAADALTAFGPAEQEADLRRLGTDFVTYLACTELPEQNVVPALERPSYPKLDGVVISAASQHECKSGKTVLKKRAARIITPGKCLIRGFGDPDYELTLVFAYMTSDDWTALAAKLNWDPEDLSKANQPGIAWFIQGNPEMSLLSPVSWM